jgi:hypothetical protein
MKPLLALALASAALAACTASDTHAPPAASQHFVNSAAYALSPTLAQRYVDFSFDYPGDWTPDADNGAPTAQSFVRFVRADHAGATIESVAVGSYRVTGDPAADQAEAPRLLASLERQVSATPGYRRVSMAEPTTVDGLPGYQLTFTAAPVVAGATVNEFGRVILLPGPAGQPNGVTLLLLGTDRSGELHSVADLGAKGQLPVILNSFRFGAAAAAEGGNTTGGARP